MCEDQLQKSIWLMSLSHELVISIVVDSVHTSIPVATAFAHLVDSLSKRRSYTVGYSLSKISYHPSKLDFISNVCQAAFLASNTCVSGSSIAAMTELDGNFFFMDIVPSTDQPISNYINVDCVSINSKELTDLMPMINMQQSSMVTSVRNKSGPPLSPSLNPHSNHTPCSNRIYSPSKSIRRASVNSTTSNSPSCFDQPQKQFSSFFPLDDVEIVNDAPYNIDYEELENIQLREYGKNSTIHSAVFRGEKVVVKLMMPGLEKSGLAHSEFDNEQSILRRVKHPNIVRLIGTGSVLLPDMPNQEYPLRFTVLEWLEGSLHDILSDSNKKTRVISNFLKGKKNISLMSRLLICRDIASALNYLHHASFGISIIHRAIEPDNIRFDDKGVVKVTGFGHSVCVKSRELLAPHGGLISCPVKDLHPLSLRYTPTEVALRLSYSEKTDVYSLGILMWQIVRNKVPFLDMSTSEFMDRVVYRNERPKTYKIRPVKLAHLLQKCWVSDQFDRPSCGEIIDTLESVMISGDKELNPSFLQTVLQRSDLERQIQTLVSLSDHENLQRVAKAKSARCISSRTDPTKICNSRSININAGGWSESYKFRSKMSASGPDTSETECREEEHQCAEEDQELKEDKVGLAFSKSAWF